MTYSNPAEFFDCVLVRLIIDDPMVYATQQDAVVVTVGPRWLLQKTNGQSVDDVGERRLT